MVFSLGGNDMTREQSDLRRANLRGANLWFASLCGADLRGADLRGARFWGVTMAEALYDQETKGLTPLLAFLESCKKVPAPGEVLPAAAPEGRGDEGSPAEQIGHDLIG